MSLILFEGAAGTGKTTKLQDQLQKQLVEHPLVPEQYVLALTKYHGSRRRMEAKLKGSQGVGPFVDCVTIDSFAWNLVCRWRGLARHLNIELRQGDFASITTAAGRLLRMPSVSLWVSRRYPFVSYR